MKRLLVKLYKILFRNRVTLTGNCLKRGMVNYEYWTEKDNVGDYLSYIVYQWMLERKQINFNSPAKKTCHLLGIGSIIAMRPFNAVIWGSGIHSVLTQYCLYRWKNIVKYDVRAIRGPITQNLLIRCGYDCKDAVYGDPAVLMPLIYKPKRTVKKYDISIVRHLSIQDSDILSNQYNYIDIRTKDYKHFIDEIVASKLVISSSLHGIILAESYGVPAIFVNENGKMYCEIIKYYDWYYSTNRRTVVMAESIEEALTLSPMELPNLQMMQKNLIECFPYDLWK